MSRVLKLDTPPRTVVCIALPSDLARRAKLLSLRRQVPFKEIVELSLRRYLRRVAEADVQQPPEESAES